MSELWAHEIHRRRIRGVFFVNSTRRVCLDLFAGLGGFSAAFADGDGCYFEKECVTMPDNTGRGSERRHRRTVAEKIKCGLGLHDYGEPHVMRTDLVLHGEVNDDGHVIEADESPAPGPYVIQVCTRPWCTGSRARPDLDPGVVDS